MKSRSAVTLKHLLIVHDSVVLFQNKWPMAMICISKMKAFVPTVTILLFLGGCHFSTVPAWRIAEKLLIQDVRSGVPEYFPVLSHASGGGSAVEISRWKDRESATFVTDLDDALIEEINRQLLLTVTTTPSKCKGKYFKIIRRTDSYVDVSLLVPTLHESHTEGWYRIQGHAVIPQKLLTYGPGFALITIPIALFAGLCCSVLFYLGVIIFNKRAERRIEPLNDLDAG